MTLTPENMKVDPTGNKWDGNALGHDFWHHFSVYGGDDGGPFTSSGRFFAQK